MEMAAPDVNHGKINHGKVKHRHGDSEEVDVPTHFLCPISLEVMEDPVTLCTGISYERANIDKWLNVIGQRRCPVSNQRLVSKDLLPNLVLRSLIRRWKNGMEAAAAQNFHSLIQRLQYISSPPHLLQALHSLQALLSAQHQNSSTHFRLVLSTLTSLLCRAEEQAVLEKTLKLADMLLNQDPANGVKGFVYVDLVRTVVGHTMVGVSISASLVSLRMLCRVCEKEERLCREAAESGAVSKALFLLQWPQSCSHTKKHALHLLKLLCGHSIHHTLIVLAHRPRKRL